MVIIGRYYLSGFSYPSGRPSVQDASAANYLPVDLGALSDPQLCAFKNLDELTKSWLNLGPLKQHILIEQSAPTLLPTLPTTLPFQLKSKRLTERINPRFPPKKGLLFFRANEGLSILNGRYFSSANTLIQYTNTRIHTQMALTQTHIMTLLHAGLTTCRPCSFAHYSKEQPYQQYSSELCCCGSFECGPAVHAGGGSLCPRSLEWCRRKWRVIIL